MHLEINKSGEWSEALRAARERSGLTLRQVARECSVSPAIVGAFEAGVDVPQGKVLARLKGVFPELRGIALERPRLTAQIGEIVLKEEQVLVPMKSNQIKKPAVTYATWGEALAACMDQENMAVKQVAELLGKGSGIVYQWRNNRERPGPKSLEKLQDLFPSLKDAPEPVPPKNRNPGVQARASEQQRARREARKKLKKAAVEVAEVAEAVKPAPVLVRASIVEPDLFGQMLNMITRLHEERVRALTDLALDHGAEGNEVEYALRRAELRATKHAALQRKTGS